MLDRNKKVEEDFIHSVHIGTININICEHHHTDYRLVLQSLKYKSLNIQNSIIMAVTISTSEFITGSLGLVDHATGNPVTGVSFSGASFSSSDSTIFTAIADTTDPNSVVVTGVAVGVANLLVTVVANYTDPNTGQPISATKTATISVTVVASPISTDLVVNFGTPQPQV